MVTYTQSRRQRWEAVCSSAPTFVAVWAALRLVREGIPDSAVPLVLVAMLAGLAGLPLGALVDQRRRLVVVDREGLTSITLWRTRRLAWPSIRDLEVARPWTGGQRLVALTDHGPVRLAVPHLPPISSRGTRAQFEDVANALGEHLGRRRGSPVVTGG